MSERKNWKVWVTDYPDEGSDVYENQTKEEALRDAAEDFDIEEEDLSIKEATEDEVEASHAEP